MKPLHDYVLVRLTKPSTTTPGGIFITAPVQDHTREGVVVEVGPGAVHPDGVFRFPSAGKGARVLFSVQTPWIPVKHEGEDHALVRDAALLAILPD